MNTKELLINEFKISEQCLEIVEKAEKSLSDEYAKADDIMEFNQFKVLKAFQDNRINDTHFGWNTGYGYDDAGRDAVERLYADIFGAEAALVRPIIVNGTHAISLALCGVLRPGDELIYCTGEPYDTIHDTIGIKGEGKGSLKDFGITYKQIDLSAANMIDLDALKAAISPKTRMVAIQRATGYAFRKAITLPEIEECFKMVKEISPDIICMVDNCYGEFLDYTEPTERFSDIMAGSLIKNPGGGLALSGGYIVGKTDLIEQVSYRMTTPGIGGECGLTFGQTRTMMQGLFMAPKVVNGAVKGATLCGEVFKSLGYRVCPNTGDTRSDIIEAIEFGSPEKVIAFCEGVQAAAPIDSYVTPMPWDMPGYDDQVIMAAGAFVQGSSIELSADSPIREPYIAYFQGGLTYEHSKFGVLKALDTLIRKNLI